MIIPSAGSVSSDERALAALAHASVILPGFGFTVPLIIWIVQRKKSTFVTFHALQALLYQLFQTVFWWIYSIFLFALMMAAMMGSIATIDSQGSPSSPFLFFLPQIIIFGGIFLGFALFAFLGILGGILTLARKDYRYPVLGHWLERYLSQSPKAGAQTPEAI